MLVFCLINLLFFKQNIKIKQMNRIVDYYGIPLIPLYIPGHSPDRNKNVFNIAEKIPINTKLPIIESKNKNRVKKSIKSKHTSRT